MRTALQVARIDRLVKNSGGEITEGGDEAPDGKFFPPTIISRPNMDDPIMTEEIFGPALFARHSPTS